MLNYKQSNLLFYLRIRVPKDVAYFVYFTLESNEGICYHSTSDDSLNGPFRDIDIYSTIEFKDALKSLIQRLQCEFRLDILTENITQDS